MSIYSAVASVSELFSLSFSVENAKMSSTSHADPPIPPFPPPTRSMPTRHSTNFDSLGGGFACG